MDSSGNIREIETDMSKEQWESYVDNIRADRDFQLEDLQTKFNGLKNNEVPLKESEAKELKTMSKPRRKNWMRNQPCICGSGKKMKKCCWGKMAQSVKA